MAADGSGEVGRDRVDQAADLQRTYDAIDEAAFFGRWTDGQRIDARIAAARMSEEGRL